MKLFIKLYKTISIAGTSLFFLSAAASGIPCQWGSSLDYHLKSEKNRISLKRKWISHHGSAKMVLMKHFFSFIPAGKVAEILVSN